MKEDKLTLGQFLQEARERKELTLRAVEKAVGVSNAYLSQLEGGKIRQPSPVVLHRLSDLYEISYSDTLQLAGYPVPKQRDSDSLGRLAARIGPVTKAEEDALVEYLEFLRSRRRRGSQP